MRAADLPAVLAVQAQCYGPALLESADALASRLALSPDTCWVAALPDPPGDLVGHLAGELAGYLFTHAWPETALPPLDGVLSADWQPAEPLTWFVHDMAIAPAGRGSGVAARLYAAAEQSALAAGFTSSRLVAVQSAAAWWRRVGYAPLPPAETASQVGKLAAYGEDAVWMERRLGG